VGFATSIIGRRKILLRVGIVGAGGIARPHLATLLQIPDIKVIGIADPVEASAAALATQAGATAYADHNELLGKVDAVWICTPTYCHADQTIEFARAGVHVFCEKPIALDLSAADRMIVAAREARVQLMIGQVIRYYPETIAIKALLENGDLGNPVYVYGRRLFKRTVALAADWRRDVGLSGGMALESGVHEVDTVRWLGGEIVEIGGNVVYSDPEYPRYDTDFRGSFRLASAATGAVEISTHHPLPDWSWGIVGTEAVAFSPRRGEVQVARSKARGETEVRMISVEPVFDSERQINRSMFAENRAFVDAILTGRPVPIPGEEGRRNLEVILRVKQGAANQSL
jgi:predicted dehydrogenase